MERKIYLKPSVKMLDTRIDETMFTPGGGSALEPMPDTPGVGAKENSFEEDDFESYPSYSVWED